MSNETTAVKTAASVTPKAKFKLFHKPPKGKMAPLFIVFLWIALWNIVFQVLHHSFHDMPVVSWAFFISVTIFFMQEELSYKEKFWHTLIGGCTGLLLAAGVISCCKLLVANGVPLLGALCPLVVLAVAMLLLLRPIIPLVFNNVGFCYFIIALIDSSTTASRLGDYMLSLLLGSLILNLGCIALITSYIKLKKKKALSAGTQS